METINKLGIGIGGLDDSALSSDVIDSDGGTWSTVIPEPVIIIEHEVGNLKYEYDTGSEGWKLRSGRAGTTGKPQVAAGELKWLCKSDLPNDAKKYVWQKINTDSYGNPVAIATCINTNPSMPTSTWDPATGTTGIIWRRLASIEPNTDITCEVSCKKSWAMKAINENNAFMLPIARRYGSLQGWGNIYLKEDADVKDRGSSSHWAPVMYGEGGLSNLIQSIGELGGTFVYQTKEGCGSDNDYGIGIASGIEFYDDISIRESYNCHEMRPKPTRACAPLGPGGRYGKIIIQSVNPKHPWQFQLSADFDIGSLDPGSCGGWDPGSQWWECQIDKMPMADGPVCGGAYFNWGGRHTTPEPSPLQKGIMDGSVTRLTNNGSLWCGKFSSWWPKYRAGEIRCGGIGIGTAQFQWTTDYNKDNPSDGDVMSNTNGGLITGIMNDSPCRYNIDHNGFIHAPNPDWMGRYGVKLPTACADAVDPRLQGKCFDVFDWGNSVIEDNKEWNKKTDSFCKIGGVNGIVSSIVPNMDPDKPESWLWPSLGDTAVYISDVLGEVHCSGTIGIGSALYFALTQKDAESGVFDPNGTYKNENLDCKKWAMLNPGGGIIRGIQADIPYVECSILSYPYAASLPPCYRTIMHPAHLPFIDLNGIIHIPVVNFLVTCQQNHVPTLGPEWTTYICTKWRNKNGTGGTGGGEGGGGEINPGGGGGGGGYVPVPIP